MIQTVDKYIFLYRSLIEGILTKDTYVSLHEFITTRKVQMDIKNQYKVRTIERKLKKSIFFKTAFRTVTNNC
jgi:hypothetical protein